MRNSYPKILFPHELSQRLKLKPQLIEYPKIPEIPVKVQFKKPEEVAEDSMGCLGYGIIAMMISGLGMLLFNAGLTFGGFLVPIGGFMIMYYAFGWESIKEKKSNKRDAYIKSLREYDQNVQKSEFEYKTKLTEYNNKKNSYKNDCIIVDSRNLELQSENYILSSKIEKIKKFFQEAKSSKSFNTKLQRSVTHSFFKQYLSEEFPNQIFDNFYFKNDEYEKLVYVPDYVVYDKSLNLFIDIEVDEPYIGNDGTPIHFKNGNDDERDKFLLRKRWVVIRFAEIQIIQNPDACCDLIKNVIVQLKNGNLEIEPTNQLHDKEIQFWSKEEGYKLAFQKSRNIYLPIELQQSLESEKLEIDRNNLNPQPKYLDDLPF